MRNFLIALFYLNTYFLASQISFTNLPKDKQLFGRDFQTNYGIIQISGEVNVGDNYNLQYSSWAPGEPNNNPDPENAAEICLLYTSPSPRDRLLSRMPSSA